MTFKLFILMAVVVFLFTSGCANKQLGSNFDLFSAEPGNKDDKAKVILTEEEKTALRQADMWVPDEKE